MKYIPILLINLQLLSATAKDLELGLLDDIEEAVKAEMPLQQDLNIFVEVDPDGYATPLELDASALQMNGFSIDIAGSAATHQIKSKSAYFDDDLVVEFDAETGNESEYINAIGPDGIEGRVDISDGMDLVYYYTKDHLGSITGTVFEGELQEAKFYYAYGNTEKLSVAAEKTKEGFTGKEFDEEGFFESVNEGINLHYFGARYYDSDIGLWISPDPAKQFHSLYSYGSNPVISIDPDGKEMWIPKGPEGEKYVRSLEKISGTKITTRKHPYYGVQVVGFKVVDNRFSDEQQILSDIIRSKWSVSIKTSDDISTVWHGGASFDPNFGVAAFHSSLGTENPRFHYFTWDKERKELVKTPRTLEASMSHEIFGHGHDYVKRREGKNELDAIKRENDTNRKLGFPLRHQ